MDLNKKTGMTFREAWFAMLNGKFESDTIMMHCKDGAVIDIRATENVAYTMSNVASNDWMIAGK